MARYVLCRDIFFMGATMRAGKVIDDTLYNLAQLQASGAVLVSAAGTALQQATVLQQRDRRGRHGVNADEGARFDAVPSTSGGGSLPAGTVAGQVLGFDGAQWLASYELLLTQDPAFAGNSKAVQYTGGVVTRVAWTRTSTGKLIKSQDFTYSGGLVQTITTKVYGPDGATILAQTTETEGYSGGQLTTSSVTRDV